MGYPTYFSLKMDEVIKSVNPIYHTLIKSGYIVENIPSNIRFYFRKMNHLRKKKTLVIDIEYLLWRRISDTAELKKVIFMN